MKAVISDRIYLAGGDELYKELKQKLLYKIPQYGVNSPDLEICDVYRIRNIISIPIGRFDLIPIGYEIVDKRISNIVNLPKLDVILRESQQKIYDSVNDNCIINAKVGFGKTITALSLIDKFKEKALILVHTKLLLDQWVKEIEKLYGITPGIMQGPNKDLNSPIVVGMVQTCIKNTDMLSREFGIVITDECHHTPSTTFTGILNKLKARYKIGLSGTLTRKDNKGAIIPDYFSYNIIQPKQENTLVPEVHTIFLDEELPVSKNWADRITELHNNETYVNIISEICKVYADKGHKVLFLSDRVAFLEELYEILPNSILITGATRNRDELISLLTDADVFNILLGSSGIFKEGISINQLSCLILGMQTNNIPLLEQLIGRVIRIHDGKLSPVIVDIVLTGYTAYNQYKDRLAHYNNQGYIVKNF